MVGEVRETKGSLPVLRERGSRAGAVIGSGLGKKREVVPGVRSDRSRAKEEREMVKLVEGNGSVTRLDGGWR